MATIFWLSIYGMHIGAISRIRLFMWGRDAALCEITLTTFYGRLRSRCVHYILSCGFSNLLLPFSSRILSHRRLPYFQTWCGPSANLGCRSEMCCTQLARNAGCKKSPKIRHVRTIAQLCRAISSQLRHVLTIGKKFVKQQYLLHMSSQDGELRPTNG